MTWVSFMDKGRRVGAVVVTYYPAEEVASNIARIAAQVDTLCIVDNTKGSSVPVWQNPANVIVINNGDNLGIATALNQGMASLLQAGIDDVFLFDQDSRIPEGMIEKMCLFRDAASVNKGELICAPNFMDVNAGTMARFAVLGKWRYRSISCSDAASAPLHVDFAITSGTLLSREVWLHLGKFRDDYFIDHVDSEYCLRAALNGVAVVVNCEVTLQHAIGHRQVRSLLGLTIKPNNHAEIRRYYITRNGIRLMLEYGFHFPSFIFLSVARLAHEFLSIAFFEERRLSKLGAMLRGVRDGALGRMGPGS